jgi:hypothetical protein
MRSQCPSNTNQVKAVWICSDSSLGTIIRRYRADKMVIRCSKERAFIKVRMILDLDTAYKVLSSGNSNVIKMEDHTKVPFKIHRS